MNSRRLAALAAIFLFLFSFVVPAVPTGAIGDEYPVCAVVRGEFRGPYNTFEEVRESGLFDVNPETGEYGARAGVEQVPCDTQPPDPDPDGDGVPNDGTDKCPEVTGNAPDGCYYDPDPDGDGVPNDGTDKCPDTPVETEVDAIGCPAPMPEHRVFIDHSVSVSDCEAGAVTEIFVEEVAQYSLENGEWVLSDYIPTGVTKEMSRSMTESELAECQPDNGGLTPTPSPSPSATAEPTTPVATETPTATTVPTQEPTSTVVPTEKPVVPPSDGGHTGGEIKDEGSRGDDRHTGNYTPVVTTPVPSTDVDDPGVVDVLPDAGSGPGGVAANAVMALSQFAILAAALGWFVRRRGQHA